MKNSFSGKSRFLSLFRGRGVYVALAASVLALGGVTLAMLGTESLSGGRTESGDSSLNEPVEQIVTGEPANRTTTTTTTSLTTTTTATTTAPEQDTLYVLPLSNTVQKPFSADAPLYCVTMGDWRVHTGTDFAGEAGQTVKAITGGTVTAVEEDVLWGWCVTVDHGVGVVSRYCGVKPSVKVGDTLEVAQPLGKLGTIPCESAQAPHLHLDLYMDERPVDPVAALALEVRYAETLAEPEN